MYRCKIKTRQGKQLLWPHSQPCLPCDKDHHIDISTLHTCVHTAGLSVFSELHDGSTRCIYVNAKSQICSRALMPVQSAHTLGCHITYVVDGEERCANGYM